MRGTGYTVPPLLKNNKLTYHTSQCYLDLLTLSEPPLLNYEGLMRNGPVP